MKTHYVEMAFDQRTGPLGAVRARDLSESGVYAEIVSAREALLNKWQKAPEAVVAARMVTRIEETQKDTPQNALAVYKILLGFDDKTMMSNCAGALAFANATLATQQGVKVSGVFAQIVGWLDGALKVENVNLLLETLSKKYDKKDVLILFYNFIDSGMKLDDKFALSSLAAMLRDSLSSDIQNFNDLIEKARRSVKDLNEIMERFRETAAKYYETGALEAIVSKYVSLAGVIIKASGGDQALADMQLRKFKDLILRYGANTGGWRNIRYLASFLRELNRLYEDHGHAHFMNLVEDLDHFSPVIGWGEREHEQYWGEMDRFMAIATQNDRTKYRKGEAIMALDIARESIEQSAASKAAHGIF